ncbi:MULTISPECIES: phospholipase D-like domain-containing protein [unclassified Bradyrhizobium]|uniref:phospholipase D-like domain-containing protein n=1 Tax=unclassified Bradyrhizobium TaxID=2631580 RepID=UPI002916AAA6|nr:MULTISPECIES: phospholipase D-like domain-containing protein [unclassified Bradyrhizobium]
MRKRSKPTDPFPALAIAGSHVVLLGWDYPAASIRKDRVLGFAIERTRHSDGEVIWLPGMKTFQAVEPNPAPGVPVTSYKHPLQTFQWSDYTVEEVHEYTYRIVPRCGAPTALTDGPDVSLKVTTEGTKIGKHAVFFNRGAVASQEYARRFQNRAPDEVGQAAFDWLSRGLIEGLETYIEQAGDGDELYGAFFEFKNKEIYTALKAAKKRGATVKILYDGKTQGDKNRQAMEGAGVGKMVKPRIHTGQFAHNKFLVLRKGETSEQVWTGSTNLSENGIYGHSNNAHIVRDRNVAEKYFEFWSLLDKDLTKKPTAEANDEATPVPADPWDKEVTPVFSPQTELGAMDWYAKIAGKSERALFMTFAFGMNSRFVDVYDRKDDVLRFALMEKKGNGKTMKQQSAEIDRIRKLPNTVVSVGHKVELNNFDRWLEEIDKITDEQHVLYVHTKYMISDPLGSNPVIIVGSANFSDASAITNDENMLVIKGNEILADIYLGEFMRLFSHYAFRESLSFKDSQTPAAALLRKCLIDNPNWIDGERPSASYFAKGTDRTLRRLYFSGQ